MTTYRIDVAFCISFTQALEASKGDRLTMTVQASNHAAKAEHMAREMTSLAQERDQLQKLVEGQEGSKEGERERNRDT